MERVTSTSLAQRRLADLQASARRTADLREDITTGKQLRRVSDSPAQAVASLDLRAQVARSAQLDRNADDALRWLNSADSALLGGVEILNRARTLLVQATNASADPTARYAAAAELDLIADDLVSVANTTVNGRPLFAGSAAVTVAYNQDGTYAGNGLAASDNAAVLRTVAPNVTVQANQIGPDVFGYHDPADPANGNVFQVIRQAAEDLRSSNVTAARAGIDRVDSARDTIAAAQVEIGARTRQVEDATFRSAAATLGVKDELSQIEDTDYAEALIRLKSTEAAYEAALAVTARTIQPTLLDFLR